MALVVFLRGVNVGGHRTFRPALLAQELRSYGVVNIGAAGTFVARRPIAQAKLRAELARRLPFETHIMISEGREVLRVAASDPFAGQREGREGKEVVHFVSVLAKRPRPLPSLPLVLPAKGRWGLKVLALKDRFAFGVYRREMKAIGHLGSLDKLLGVPVTTRSWSTLQAIARVLEERPS